MDGQIMDFIVDMIMIGLGIYFTYCGVKALKYQDIKTYYRNNIPKINPSLFNEYSYKLGRTLFILGVGLIMAGCLYILNDLIGNTLFFWFVQAFLASILIYSFYCLRQIVKKYHEK